MFGSSAGLSFAIIRQTDGMWHVMVGHAHVLPSTISYAAASVFLSDSFSLIHAQVRTKYQ